MTHSDDPSSNAVFAENLRAVHLRADQLFFWLLLVQWALAVVLALVLSPFSWEGTTRAVHPHVWLALLFGGVLNALPLTLLTIRPGWWGTRHVVAVVQMMWSGVFIHITGGRIETHFHVFGSLAFLAFYRDWKLLPTGTVAVAADHLTRGFFWPEAVYGIANPEWWRFLEHAGWVAFENTVLVLGCLRSIRDMRVVVDREIALARTNVTIEAVVKARTGELAAANASLQDQMRARLQAEAELRQAQKLEAVGRLASGVAHEINTPVQFVSDSIHFLKEATADLMNVIGKLQVVQQSVLDGTPSADAAVEAAEAADTADLPYLVEHMPKALDRSIEGLDRVATIVRSMKEFAHPDSKEALAVDLNRAIESTLVIARNEYKYVADVETEFGELPMVVCHVGDLNQAVLNILVNAGHAIGDVVKGTTDRGTITIRTRHDGDDVLITISDTGGGIPDAIKERIFDPFFTTKEVGRGTGQGLAIARSVVVEKHKGELTIETEVGKGTTFVLRIPVEPPVTALAEGAAA